jgi:hypothetical protein
MLSQGSIQLVRQIMKGRPREERAKAIYDLLAMSLEHESENRPQEAEALMEYAQLIDEMIG